MTPDRSCLEGLGPWLPRDARSFPPGRPSYRSWPSWRSSLTWGRALGPLPVTLVALVLAAAVLAAVHHAEVVAHRVGEPFGSLVLAVAVTVIEVALIVTLMVSGGAGDGVPGPRHRLRRGDDHVQRHPRALAAASVRCVTASPSSTPRAPAAALATVATLATLSLVLPTFTTSRPARSSASAQLAFAAVASLALYGAVRRSPRPSATATSSCRSPSRARRVRRGRATPTRRPTHARAPSGQRCAPRCCLALVAVVGLAKVESPAIEAGVAAVGFPPSFVGVVIAAAGAAARDARGGRGPPAATACRPASTSRSARRWPASA